MRISSSRRQFLQSLLAGGQLALTGCGTIFFPERRGQPAGPLDWRVVLLDGIGLLFFFIPGVIAFAVDFSNGTIYLPPEECGRSVPPGGPQELVPFPGERPSTAEDIERRVSRASGRSVRLVEGEFRSEPMTSLAQFETLRAAKTSGTDDA